MKKNSLRNYLSLLLYSLLVLSCSKESDVLFETVEECSDTLLTTRTVDTNSVSYEGGRFTVQNIPVICKITNYHQHSILLNCTPTEYSGSRGWYSVDVINFTTANVLVQPNTTFISRAGKVGNETFTQAGKPQGSNIDWNGVKPQYTILGPKWVQGEEYVSFTLTGPYLSPTEVSIYWTINKFYNFGGGTILSGDKTTTITAFFHNPDNGGIVRVRVEPVKSPSAGFTIEHIVGVN